LQAQVIWLQSFISLYVMLPHQPEYLDFPRLEADIHFLDYGDVLLGVFRYRFTFCAIGLIYIGCAATVTKKGREILGKRGTCALCPQFQHFALNIAIKFGFGM